jgi:hypothetical protein
MYTRRMTWARNKDMSGVYWVLVGRPDANRPLGKPMRRWKGNIKIYLQEVGGGHGLDSSGSG